MSTAVKIPVAALASIRAFAQSVEKEATKKQTSDLKKRDVPPKSARPSDLYQKSLNLKFGEQIPAGKKWSDLSAAQQSVWKRRAEEINGEREKAIGEFLASDDEVLVKIPTELWQQLVHNLTVAAGKAKEVRTRDPDAPKAPQSSYFLYVAANKAKYADIPHAEARTKLKDDWAALKELAAKEDGSAKAKAAKEELDKILAEANKLREDYRKAKAEYEEAKASAAAA